VGKTVMPLRNIQRALPASPFNSDGLHHERKALDQLFSLTYEELRRLASTVKRGDGGMTLSPTALVNEAWIKLAKTPGLGEMSQLHFKRIAARAMRQLLVEAARRRNSRKRGGEGEAIFVTFDDAVDGGTTCDRELLALNVALDELARLEPRQATIVESRFFGGVEISEIAVQLGISEATVFREWRATKAWLGQELRRAH
jgi:RNA polymerase sigma factor (TIGR02999 family)